MTIDEALAAMSAAESLFDGSERSAERVAQLSRNLVEDPGSFWENYLNSFVDDPVRQLGERLIQTGIVTDRTKFGDLAAILAGQQ